MVSITCWMDTVNLMFKCPAGNLVNIKTIVLVTKIGHSRFSYRRYPYLNLVELSLSLSQALMIHQLPMKHDAPWNPS